MTKGKPYDVLIVDLNLPGVSGGTFIKKLRGINHPRAKTVPIIIMTGENNPNTYKSLEPYGISSYLIKPVSQDGIKAAIEKALSGHVARTTPERSAVIHEKNRF